MYILLSPTKTMIHPSVEFDSFEKSTPYFKSKAELINSALKKLNKKEIQNLMKPYKHMEQNNCLEDSGLEGN